MTDALYKQLFSHPEIVRDLVAGLLSAEWARTLEASAFERVNASYAGDRGQQRSEDVVWRARIGGEWVYVYILLEFQSRPDKWMALRMQVYVGLLYQDLVAQHKLSKHGKLPPVLPVVLYHGRRAWTATTELAELMLPPPTGLERFQPGQSYLLIDRHHSAVHSNIVALLFRVLRARSEQQMRAAAEVFLQRVSRPDLEPARASLERWLRLTLQADFENTNMDLEEVFAMKPVKHKLGELLPPDFFTNMLKPNEEAMRQGRQLGIEQGMQQGLEQGHRQALQEVIAELLDGKDTPSGAAEKIARADHDQLRAWIKALFDGASPRQLFAEG